MVPISCQYVPFHHQNARIVFQMEFLLRSNLVPFPPTCTAPMKHMVLIGSTKCGSPATKWSIRFSSAGSGGARRPRRPACTAAQPTFRHAADAPRDGWVIICNGFNSINEMRDNAWSSLAVLHCEMSTQSCGLNIVVLSLVQGRNRRFTSITEGMC